MKRIEFILLAAATWCLGSFFSTTFAQNWTSVPGAASDVGVGANGTVWVIGTAAEVGGYGIYKYNGSGLTKVSGGALRCAVDPQGFVWVVNDQGTIFKHNGSGWDTHAGQKATDIAVGADGTVWVIGNIAETGGYGLYKKSGTSWTKVSGGALRIAVDPQGNPWVVNSNNTIFKFHGTGWTTMPGAGKDIGIGAEGSVWITTPDGKISKWNGTAWEVKTGGAESIAVGPAGEAWVVNAQGQIFKSDTPGAITTQILTGNVTVTTGQPLQFPRQQDWESKICSALGMTGVAASYSGLNNFQKAIGTMALVAAEAYFPANNQANITPHEVISKLQAEILNKPLRDALVGLIGTQVIENLSKNQNDAQSIAIRDWAVQVYRQIKVDAAVGTLKEYNTWKANPCTYSAPGYTKPQDCQAVIGNNPYNSMWKTSKPPHDLLMKAGLTYAAGNTNQIVQGVSGALAGIGLVGGVAAATAGLGIAVGTITTSSGAAVPLLTCLYSAFGGTFGSTAGAIGATSWAGVVAGPAAVITAAVMIGVSQGAAVIEGEQAEWKIKQAIRVAMSENINMANVVADQSAGALFFIGLVKSAQNGWKAPSLEIEGEVTFFCEAGYVSKFYLTYTLNGQPKSFSTNNMTAGFWQKFTIPAAAKNIQVRGVMISTGEHNIFTQNLDRPTYVCYKVYGTIFQTAWNNDWPMSVNGEVSDAAGKIKFIHGAGFVANWQITYDLPEKPQQKINPTGTTLGWKETYHLPLDATNVHILVQGATGLVWEPWRTTYALTFPTAPNLCLKIYGTTLDQKWNSDCN